jgi:hypothetical protein
MAITAVPITQVKTLGANTGPQVANPPEDAAETFKAGTVVALNGSGNLIAWAGANPGGAAAIAGISIVAGSNLSVAATAQTLTFGSVPNQSSAVNIPVGAPPNDGHCEIYTGSPNNVFQGTFGNNGNTATPAASDVGVHYGLSIDSGSNYWYVDKNKTTVGTNTAVQVVGVYPDPNQGGAAFSTKTQVQFVFEDAVVQAVV